MAINEQLVKEFIEKHKKAGTSEPALRKLYETAKKSGTFDVKEVKKESLLSKASKGFVDVSRNIYEWVENTSADIINIWAGIVWSDVRVKPLREQLIPTWEEYTWGMLQKSADIIEKKATNIFDIQSEYSEWPLTPTRAGSATIQTSWELWWGISWVLWEVFMAWLSDLTG